MHDIGCEISKGTYTECLPKHESNHSTFNVESTPELVLVFVIIHKRKEKKNSYALEYKGILH